MAAKEKEAKALPEGQAENPKKPSKLKRMIILLAILLMTLSGAGIGGYWWFFIRTPSAASAARDAAAADAAAKGGDAAHSGGQGAGGAHGASSGGSGGANGAGGSGASGGSGGAAGDGRIERQSDLPRSAGQVLPLPPITVNISDPSGRRYLKLGMEVEVNADVSSALQANSARIRDAIIMLLAGKTFSDISTPDGKVLLKAEVAARLNQILGAQRIIRVYFTDFVVE